MTAMAVDGPGPGPGEGHFETMRASWDRLREWDAGHRFLSDAAITALILAVCLTFPRRFGIDRPENILLQLALVLPLAWRRRAPSTVFAVIALVALLQWIVTVPLPADVALLVALFTLAVHARPGRALAGAGILELGVVMASVRWAPAGDVNKSLVFLSGLVVAALFIGLTLRTWRAYLDSLVERTRRLELERDQQAEIAASAERARIAREMHDVVAHNVSIMVTLAEGARAVTRSNPEQAYEVMGEVAATGRLALGDMRHLLGVLRPSGGRVERSPQPELSGIPQLIQGVRSTGLDVTFDEAGRTFDVPPGVGLTIYRIVQESLTNVVKHADRPTAAQVVLTFDQPFVAVAVRDDGRPVAASRTGHGLDGMRERAAMCGGALDAGPGAESGWEVTARVRVDR